MSTLLKKAYTTAVFSQPLLGELTKEFCTWWVLALTHLPILLLSTLIKQDVDPFTTLWLPSAATLIPVHQHIRHISQM
jgi:hypothetical protein